MHASWARKLRTDSFLGAICTQATAWMAEPLQHARANRRFRAATTPDLQAICSAGRERFQGQKEEQKSRGGERERERERDAGNIVSYHARILGVRGSRLPTKPHANVLHTRTCRLHIDAPT